MIIDSFFVLDFGQEYYNTNGMAMLFLFINLKNWCHADFARNKPQWNLEPWRPVVSWSKMISKRCNP